jgi:tetratricopeptide (TPR) repeat protein
MMDLYYSLAIGDINIALVCIQKISSPGTWAALAQMCAQMKHVDLTKFCFSRMQKCGSALLIRNDPSDEIAAIIASAQLGMKAEAIESARSLREYDILAELKRSVSDTSGAVKTAQVYNHIRLKSELYKSARSSEILGDFKSAILGYDESGCFSFELPRIALQMDSIYLLFNFISESAPPEVPPNIFIWIAKYCEVHNLFDDALRFYKSANSLTDQFRIMVLMNQIEEAICLATQINKRSSTCYHARLLMEHHLDKSVLMLFRRSHQYSQAMNYAIQNNLDDDIHELSYSAPPPALMKAAQYFEAHRNYKSAIIMYFRASNLKKALTLSLKHHQYDVLTEISLKFNNNMILPFGICSPLPL